MVVSEPGLNGQALEDLATRLIQSDSSHLGGLTLTDRWSFAQDADIADLTVVLDAAGVDTADLSPEQLRPATWNAVFGVDPPAGQSGSGESATAPPPVGDFLSSSVDVELLRALADAGFVSITGLSDDLGSSDDLSGEQRLAVVLVTGHDSSLVEGGHGVAAVLPSVSAAGAPLVVAEVASEDEGSPERGTLIDSLRSAVDAEFSSVDNLDEPAGAVAVVLAVAERLAGGIGNYGFGPGANSTLPRWSSE
jgi:hypothetical protein